MASNVNEIHTHDVDADVAAVMEEMEAQTRDGKRHSVSYTHLTLPTNREV